jgi:transposase
MEALRECCAGLDVHQKTIVACILKGNLEEKPRPYIQTFGTTTKELLGLQDWLMENGCEEVAMESTGVLWKPVWNVLESTCNLVLANARQIKNMPGRKTDKKDAQWIAQLHRCGLIEPSVVLPVHLRDLRDWTRYRVTKCLQGNKYLKRALTQASWANDKSQNLIGQHFRRIRKRRGDKKACVATGHLILRIIYAMMKNKTAYKEVDVLERTPTEKTLEYYLKQIQGMGFVVQVSADTAS